MSAAATAFCRDAVSPGVRVRELVTPEGVDLRIALAEASERAGAFLLDAAMIVGSLVALTLVVTLAVLLGGFRGFAREALPVIWLLGFFFLRNFYFMGFELSPRAASPGKRIIGLRVAARNGGALTAEAIFVRNAMRELEVFLPITFMVASAFAVDAWIEIIGIVWCAIFVFFPLLNRDRLRVGDLVGGTWVVRMPKSKLWTDLAVDAAGKRIVFSDAALDAYGIKELNVLEDVLRRRDPATMKAVAARICGKLGLETQEPDAEFLSAYYAALRGRLEQRLLFGRRRRDKHDAV
ncbi:MAG TPA: RDD family protein [Rhizomicrobium sp.]